MNIWELTILKIIDSNNGTASLQYIYSKIPVHIDLTANHLERKYNAPMYHHQTRAHVDDLLDREDLKRTGKGVYSITPKGKKRISS